tara:strand:+ start:881 stop:1123 length:243 start_codon:yes stop_codon:yes gene_type:complete
MSNDVNLDKLQLSDQALGAMMMALQKSLLEQSDITPVLKGFKFANNAGELVVLNPPIVKFGVEALALDREPEDEPIMPTE